MDKRFLVLVHAGDASRHAAWLQTTAGRNWDLVVCYAGAQPGRYAAEQEGVVRIDRAGPRWPTLAQLLADTHSGWQGYDHVWIPADDLDITGDEINRLFDIAAGLKLPLAHPAFSADTAGVDPLLMRNAAFGLRYANFSDTAAPLFSRELLSRALPALAAGDSRPWLALLQDPARECAVIDRVSVRRSRIAGAGAAASDVTPRLCWGGADADGGFRHLFDAADDGFIDRLRDGCAGLPGATPAWLQRLVAEHRAARAEVLGDTTASPGRSAPQPAPTALTVGTSLAPHDAAKQQRAVASWRALGFDVVSFNIADEIRLLQPEYPQVRFVEVKRDGRERTGKPLVRVDDVFAWFRASGLPRGGFVNADIVLQPADPAAFLADLARELPGAMLFSRRIEVDSMQSPQGRPYETGFDAWFWDSRVLAAFEQPTDYYVGFPHWDYYAILMPLLHGFPIREFTYPLAYHEKHAMYYDVVRDGIPYGLKTFALVAPRIDRIPATSHLLTPVVQYLLQQQPGSMKTQRDIDHYYVCLHALDAWFLDVIDRNSAKITAAPAAAAAAARPAAAPAPVARAAAPLPSPLPAPAPELSVIVPTFNRAAILAQCLQHLAAQTLAPERFEVIVVDDGSVDDTPAVLAAATLPCALRHERQDNRGPAAARNRALQRARGRWVMFLNDDALLAPRALEIHLEEHARRGPRAAVVGAFPMHPAHMRLDGPVGHCIEHADLVFDYWKMKPGVAYNHGQFYTCNLSIARDFVLRHGGFDEDFVRMGSEDIELGLRLHRDGCEVFYRPDCVAQHAHRLDVAGLARMYEFRGKGGVHLFVLHPEEAPHYAEMPLQRVDEFRAMDQRLQPLLARLHASIERLDALPYQRTGARAALDEHSSGIDLRMLWLWPEHEIRRLIDTLVHNLERHADRAAAGQAPSLEEASGRLYPALQFIKWYHDTLAVVSSDEIRDYLASRRRSGFARVAA